MDWRLLVCLIFLAHLRVLRGIFFFDYLRDIFSFTKIGKPVSTGWILGFAICQGFERMNCNDETSWHETSNIREFQDV